MAGVALGPDPVGEGQGQADLPAPVVGDLECSFEVPDLAGGDSCQGVVLGLVDQFSARGAVNGDLEGAFQIAYDGCRKVCLALALAYGVRAKGDTGHHAAMFNAAAAALASNLTARNLVDDATDLRFIRAGSEYRAEKITPA